MKKSKKQRVAIYARVSTRDKGQDPQNQIDQLRQWCKQAGYEIVAEYVEYESGTKSAAERPEFRKMMKEASKRKFDLLLFWALDRLTREGMAQTVHYLQQLDSYNISFHSYEEPALSTDNELARDILLGVLAALAKAESKRISARTKAGLEKARKAGKQLGRPPLEQNQKEKILEAQRTGKGLRAIARETGISYSSVRRHLLSVPDSEKHPNFKTTNQTSI